MKNELLAIIGWVIGIQGALGFIGRTWSDGDWGLLHLWFTPPTALYIVMAIVGLTLGIAVDVARKKQKAARR
ncbi:hypothetical protein GCM10010329_08520 [Streptomyces spiroverticillatus]|uniref:Uncharacterized protein n=1 Tax=Streptomyces finlayi TaxID=67296 RepID=A0A918WTG7_9ACTN|nr:hypothetical protein [Streptomyces finlayi]GGZ90181.1 hypothetical protein GCM10010329_08520 [Streptomyces spiroverticillatus]GHC81038.1 hypothetical protein GCM10010334_08510 [Streptomyces finlayi]